MEAAVVWKVSHQMGLIFHWRQRWQCQGLFNLSGIRLLGRNDHVFTGVWFFFSKYGRRFISLKTHETLIKQQSCNEVYKTNDRAEVTAVGRKDNDPH